MTTSKLDLPSYLDQSEAVAARFAKLQQRESVLKVNHLSKKFTSPQGKVITALEDINFEVKRREFLSIIGPSGCGKSTLIRILAGLETVTSGTVELDGAAIDGPDAERGMVFQGYTLFPWLTVKKNVMFGLKMQGMGNATAQKEALQWIDLVGLSKFADSYPHQLSGGMKQRVAIARALANKPRVLLMDEPFGALDAQTRAQMQHYLLQIWKNVDITIVFITHDLEEAVYLSDRILVLEANPGSVQEHIEVPTPRPRSPDQCLSPEFLATRNHIENLIHPLTEDLYDNLPIFRMTQVGDEVE
ncbi:MAG: ABC transporter ATP-binding protein [Akkermansiaceae bacterium]